MTIELGLPPVDMPRPSLEALAAGVRRFGDELVPGMHVQLGDGRWAVVLDEPTTGHLGQVSVPVSSWSDLVRAVADDVEPERLYVGWGRTVRTRTPAEQQVYVDAVWEAAGNKEGNRG
jgi:hypothetical protein